MRPPELLAWQWLLRPGWPAATRLLLPAHWQQHAYILKQMVIFREGSCVTPVPTSGASVQHHAPATPLRTPRQRTRPPCCTSSIGYNKTSNTPFKGPRQQTPCRGACNVVQLSHVLYAKYDDTVQDRRARVDERTMQRTGIACYFALGAGYCTLQALDHGSTLTEQCGGANKRSPATRAVLPGRSMSSGLCEVSCNTKATSTR